MKIQPLYGCDLESIALKEALSQLAEGVKLNREIYLRNIKRGIEHYVAITESRQIVGVATLFIEQKFIHNGGRVAHIEDIAVHPQFHRQGIGKVLLDYLFKRAKLLCCYKVILNCKPELIEFYTKCGMYQHEVQMRMDL